MASRQETDYGHWRAKYVTEVSVKNVVSLWGHAANFSANPISTGGVGGDLDSQANLGPVLSVPVVTLCSMD